MAKGKGKAHAKKIEKFKKSHPEGRKNWSKHKKRIKIEKRIKKRIGKQRKKENE